jgi:CBS-domain-containing membrane protein
MSEKRKAHSHARRRGLFTKLLVEQVMETSVLTVDLTTPASSIVDLLLTAPFRALPVVDQRHRLQGIINGRPDQGGVFAHETRPSAHGIGTGSEHGRKPVKFEIKLLVFW